VRAVVPCRVFCISKESVPEEWAYWITVSVSICFSWLSFAWRYLFGFSVFFNLLSSLPFLYTYAISTAFVAVLRFRFPTAET
jgi:hypothetical protein